MRLPPELQTLVCRNMTKAKLKDARLVCRSFDQAAVPFLFDEVFVAPSYSELDIAELVASRFASYVKTITLSFVHYLNCSKEEFVELWSRDRKEETLERTDGHLEHAFKYFCKVREEYLEIMKGGGLLAQLCHILCKLICCRKVVLTDKGNCNIADSRVVHRHDAYKKEDLCSYQICPLSESDHMSFYIRSVPPFWPDKAREWFLTMLSLSVMKSCIAELEVEGEGDDGCLPLSAFTMTARQSPCAATCFKTLTKLRLSLGLDPKWATSVSVASALSAAIDLEFLSIEGDDDLLYHALGLMGAMLGGCRFMKLRSLTLAKMSSEENDLLDFLGNSPLLNHLSICEFALNRGVWQRAAVKIRAILQLKSVRFDDLVGGFPDYHPNQLYGRCSIDHHLVEDFFLRNGDNPFTKEAMFR